MVNEVNKIVFNTLVTERAINLPSVGTIAIVRKSAEMVSSNRVTPPSYVAEFSSHTEATSIIDAIARVGKVDKVTAEDIYYRWLDKVRMVTVITIEGVGRISGKSFYAEPEFIDLFNNGATKPIKISRKRGLGGFAIFLIVFTSLVLVIGGVCWFFKDDIKALLACAKMTNTTTTEVVVVEETPAVETEIAEVVIEAEPVEEQPIADVAETEELVIEEAPVVVEEDNWTKQADIRHWVVAGSYSTQENADIATQAIEKEHDDIYCDVISLGKMYAVTIFGSADREECENFMRSHRTTFEQMWIFTPKANR